MTGSLLLKHIDIAAGHTPALGPKLNLLGLLGLGVFTKQRKGVCVCAKCVSATAVSAMYGFGGAAGPKCYHQP